RCSCTACSFMVDLLRSQRDAPISARSACHRTAGQVLGANLKCSESSWGARRAHLMISTPRVRQGTAPGQNFEPANVRFGGKVDIPLSLSYVRFTPRKRTLACLPPPTLREGRHRGLARRGVAVRRGAVLVMPEGERPHPRRTKGRGVNLEDAADDNAIAEHLEIVVVPLPEGREA